MGERARTGDATSSLKRAWAASFGREGGRRLRPGPWPEPTTTCHTLPHLLCRPPCLQGTEKLTAGFVFNVRPGPTWVDPTLAEFWLDQWDITVESQAELRLQVS